MAAILYWGQWVESAPSFFGAYSAVGEDKGVWTLYHRGWTPLPPPNFFLPIGPAPFFPIFFSGAPAQNSDFSSPPPGHLTPAHFSSKTPLPPPPNPRGCVVLKWLCWKRTCYFEARFVSLKSVLGHFINAYELLNILMRYGLQLDGITLLWLAGLNITWDCPSRNELCAYTAGGNLDHFPRPLIVRSFACSPNDRQIQYN